MHSAPSLTAADLALRQLMDAAARYHAARTRPVPHPSVVSEAERLLVVETAEQWLLDAAIAWAETA